jgi:hypothetical protein
MGVQLPNNQSPATMDAAGDFIGALFQGRDMNDITPVPKLWITGITFDCGATAGTLTILKKVGGGVKYTSGPMLANTTLYMKVDPHWCMDLALAATWPAGAKAYIHFS